MANTRNKGYRMLNIGMDLGIQKLNKDEYSLHRFELNTLIAGSAFAVKDAITRRLLFI